MRSCNIWLSTKRDESSVVYNERRRTKPLLRLQKKSIFVVKIQIRTGVKNRNTIAAGKVEKKYWIILVSFSFSLVSFGNYSISNSILCKTNYAYIFIHRIYKV